MLYFNSDYCKHLAARATSPFFHHQISHLQSKISRPISVLFSLIHTLHFWCFNIWWNIVNWKLRNPLFVASICFFHKAPFFRVILILWFRLIRTEVKIAINTQENLVFFPPVFVLSIRIINVSLSCSPRRWDCIYGNGSLTPIKIINTPEIVVFHPKLRKSMCQHVSARALRHSLLLCIFPSKVDLPLKMCTARSHAINNTVWVSGNNKVFNPDCLLFLLIKC